MHFQEKKNPKSLHVLLCKYPVTALLAVVLSEYRVIILYKTAQAEGLGL